MTARAVLRLAAGGMLVAGACMPDSGGHGGAQAGKGGMMGGAAPMMSGGGMMAGTADTAAAPRAVVRAVVGAATAPGCPPVTQPLVDAGRRVFTGAGNCYACHGSDAHGTSAAPDLTDSTWLNIDGSFAAINRLVHTGVSQPKRHPAPMPALGGAALDSVQACSVAAYVYSLSR
ncbi:MAG: c-type cytochrome [Gemmatimonadota bacterium]|nr:c-type cytochrome [Gemmatimonadota bacterium]